MKFLICLILITLNLFSSCKSDCVETLNNIEAYKLSFTFSGYNTSNPFDNYVRTDNYFLKNGELIVDRVNQLRYLSYQYDSVPDTFQSWLFVNNNTYYILDTSTQSGCQYRYGTPATNQVPYTNYTGAGEDMVGSIKAQILSFETSNQFAKNGFLYVDPNDCSPLFEIGTSTFGNSLATFTSYSVIQPSVDYFNLPYECAHAHLIV